jgi:hypothetical protein
VFIAGMKTTGTLAAKASPPGEKSRNSENSDEKLEAMDSGVDGGCGIYHGASRRGRDGCPSFDDRDAQGQHTQSRPQGCQDHRQEDGLQVQQDVKQEYVKEGHVGQVLKQEAGDQEAIGS